MDTATLKQLIDHISRDIAITADFIEESFGHIGVHHASAKSLNSLVSRVDVESERRLVSALHAALPDAGFITEEDTVDRDNDAELQWVIDPLDGTTNFLKGIPVFSISVALVQQDRPILGIVHDVMSHDQYTAILGGGTYLNTQPIKVSAVTDFDQSVVATGFPYETYEEDSPMFRMFQRVVREARGMRRLGSAAIDLAYVARGVFEGYYEARLNAWDVAAGAILVSEAGGTVTDFEGGSEYLASGSIIAGVPSVHHQLLQRIQETGAYVF